MIRVSEYVPAGLVTSLGVIVLTMLTLAPRDGDGSVGIIFAPWVTREQAMLAVAALNVPIMDIRWNGRFFVVQRQDDDGPASWALPASAFLVKTIASGLCTNAAAGSGAPFQEMTQ